MATDSEERVFPDGYPFVEVPAKFFLRLMSENGKLRPEEDIKAFIFFCKEIYPSKVKRYVIKINPDVPQNIRIYYDEMI